MKSSFCVRGRVFLLLLLFSLFVPIAAQAQPVERVMILGDSWPMFISRSDAFDIAFANKGITGVTYAQDAGVALGGSEIREWAENFGLATGGLKRAVDYLNAHPTIDIVFVTLGGNDFLGRWKPWLSQAEVDQIWYEAKFGTDGQHGLKLILDTLLAARPDIKILFSSYDYISWHDDDWDMDTVQAYNVANELYARAIIDFIDEYYKDPPRAFYVNNLGLMQYRFGYPGPDVESIPPEFWPISTPGTPPERAPHGFHFNPGPAANPGDPPIFPGNEASGYVPLAGGDPNFRISPFVAQLYPPMDGWIHLSPVGYVALAENCIDQYIADWLKIPRVYSVEPDSRSPLDSNQIFNPTNLKQVEFKVTFNEPVTGVDEDDFAVIMHDGVVNAGVMSVTEEKDGESYSVLVNRGVGNGTLGLAVIDNGSIEDLDGNKLGGPLLSDGGFSHGTPYTIDSGIGLPVVAWPAVLLLLAGGVLGLRSKKNK